MLDYLFSQYLIIIWACLYGLFMKIADLLNEHGLKWFKGSGQLFGFLTGITGSLLILSDPVIANIIGAMVIAFFIRGRMDRLNHQLAGTIMTITFLFSSSFQPMLFGIFYVIFLIFGSLKDCVDDYLKKRKGAFALLSEIMLYYPIPTLIYCLMYGNWIVFWVFFCYTLFYNLIKYYYKKKGYK